MLLDRGEPLWFAGAVSVSIQYLPAFRTGDEIRELAGPILISPGAEHADYNS